MACVGTCTYVRTYECENVWMCAYLIVHTYVHTYVPTQTSSLSLVPQIVCRSHNVLTESSKQKISNFCHVPPDRVISVQDCSSIYQVPLLLEQQGMLDYLIKKLGLKSQSSSPLLLSKWRNLCARCVCLLVCLYIRT